MEKRNLEKEIDELRRRLERVESYIGLGHLISVIVPYPSVNILEKIEALEKHFGLKFEKQEACVKITKRKREETRMFGTRRCLWCSKIFDSIVASCGAGTTWDLFKCPHCGGLMASGDTIPAVVWADPKIKIEEE